MPKVIAKKVTELDKSFGQKVTVNGKPFRSLNAAGVKFMPKATKANSVAWYRRLVAKGLKIRFVPMRDENGHFIKKSKNGKKPTGRAKAKRVTKRMTKQVKRATKPAAPAAPKQAQVAQTVAVS